MRTTNHLKMIGILIALAGCGTQQDERSSSKDATPAANSTEVPAKKVSCNVGIGFVPGSTPIMPSVIELAFDPERPDFPEHRCDTMKKCAELKSERFINRTFTCEADKDMNPVNCKFPNEWNLKFSAPEVTDETFELSLKDSQATDYLIDVTQHSSDGKKLGRASTIVAKDVSKWVVALTDVSDAKAYVSCSMK